MSTDIKERALKMSKGRDRCNYPTKYCESFIRDWESVTSKFKINLRNCWKFEKVNKESDLK